MAGGGFFRDLATGGAACEPSDGAGPSGSGTQNPMSRLADVVLGDRGKHAREQQMQQAMRGNGTCATARDARSSATMGGFVRWTDGKCARRETRL